VGGKKAPAVPPPIITPIQVTVLTPHGGPVTDVEIELWSLRTKKTGAGANRIKFLITEKEFDDIIAAHDNKVDIKARKNHFGPPDPGKDTCTIGEAHGSFAMEKGKPGDFTLVLQDAGLNRFTDTFDNIPAREMTRAQARDALLCLHRQGQVILTPEPTFKHTTDPDCTTACKVLQPMVNEQVGIKAVIAGSVTLKYIDTNPPFRRKDVKLGKKAGDFLDSRYTVGVYRMAKMLRDDYGVDALLHIGMGGDSSGGRTDCHGQGRALDFGGCSVGGSDLYIYYDWGMMPVYDMNDPETDPAKKKRLKSVEWPYKDMELLYRLEATPPGGNAQAGLIFKDVYKLATEQFNDTSKLPKPSTPSTIGQKTYIMNPDHFHSQPKTPHGREAHQNHLHIQIGDTGTEPIPHAKPD
jgi:hypothetical protein